MEQEENAAIYVQNGKFKALWGSNCESVVEFADVIHEAMINITKIDQYNEGDWLWVFYDECEYLEGKKL